MTNIWSVVGYIGPYLIGHNPSALLPSSNKGVKEKMTRLIPLIFSFVAILVVTYVVLTVMDLPPAMRTLLELLFAAALLPVIVLLLRLAPDFVDSGAASRRPPLATTPRSMNDKFYGARRKIRKTTLSSWAKGVLSMLNRRVPIDTATWR